MSAGLPSIPIGHALVNIEDSFGVVYIGGMFSVGLLGVTTLQAFFYYNHFPKDALWLKLMVVVVWIVEFLRTTFLAHAGYWYLVINWGNIAGLANITWSLNTLVIMTNIGELCGHFYWSWRIYSLSKGRLRAALTSLVVFLALWNFAMGTASFAFSLRQSNLSQYTGGEDRILNPFALGTATAADLSISVILIFLLHGFRDGYSKTNRLINTIILYMIQIGALIVLADVAVIILDQYIGKIGFTYTGVYSVLGNLYANSLLASLNARSSFVIAVDGPSAIQMGTDPTSRAYLRGASQHDPSATVASKNLDYLQPSTQTNGRTPIHETAEDTDKMTDEAHEEV